MKHYDLGNGWYAHLEQRGIDWLVTVDEPNGRKHHTAHRTKEEAIEEILSYIYDGEGEEWSR